MVTDKVDNGLYGLNTGMVDSSMMPELGNLVDIRHRFNLIVDRDVI